MYYSYLYELPLSALFAQEYSVFSVWYYIYWWEGVNKGGPEPE